MALKKASHSSTHGAALSALRSFFSQHPELQISTRTKRDLTRLLVYWAVEIHGLKGVDKTLLGAFFSALDVALPDDTGVVLAQLKNGQELVITEGVYRPSATLKESLKAEFGRKPPLLEAEPHIEALIQKVTRPDAKDFLEEALLCLRANAPRAAIVMTWVVVVDHLYEFVLRHKLRDFNVELAKKHLKITAVTTKDDFSEIKREKDFIETCRAASVFNNDVKKILDEKLGIRNTGGHPSTVKVHPRKAANFIEDLVENVMLKFPL